jgi:hypothetical protein
VDVHIVQAHGHGAPQSGGAELQRAVKPGLDLAGVVSDGLQLGVLRRAQSAGWSSHFSYSFMKSMKTPP